MRLLYLTDLHGMNWKYEKSLELALSLDVDMIINGGDMLPMGNLFKQGDFIRDYLDDYFARLDRNQIYHISYLGNDDLMIFDDLFDKTCDKYDYIFSIPQRRVEIGGYEFIGMNWVVDYPFTLKDRCRKDTDDYFFQKQLGKAVLSTPNGWEELDDWFTYVSNLPTIENEINDNLVRPDDFSKTIYVIHMPPSTLKLDACQHGPVVGSKAIYQFFKIYQPLMGLHGHIHESPEVSRVWKANIGRTICIQPGQTYRKKKSLIYVIINLETMEIKRSVDPS